MSVFVRALTRDLDVINLLLPACLLARWSGAASTVGRAENAALKVAFNLIRVSSEKKHGGYLAIRYLLVRL